MGQRCFSALTDGKIIDATLRNTCPLDRTSQGTGLSFWGRSCSRECVGAYFRCGAECRWNPYCTDSWQICRLLHQCPHHHHARFFTILSLNWSQSDCLDTWRTWSCRGSVRIATPGSCHFRCASICLLYHLEPSRRALLLADFTVMVA